MVPFGLHLRKLVSLRLAIFAMKEVSEFGGKHSEAKSEVMLLMTGEKYTVSSIACLYRIWTGWEERQDVMAFFELVQVMRSRTVHSTAVDLLRSPLWKLKAVSMV